jgi:hypothetical protein
MLISTSSFLSSLITNLWCFLRQLMGQIFSSLPNVDSGEGDSRQQARHWCDQALAGNVPTLWFLAFPSTAWITASDVCIRGRKKSGWVPELQGDTGQVQTSTGELGGESEVVQRTSFESWILVAIILDWVTYVTCFPPSNYSKSKKKCLYYYYCKWIYYKTTFRSEPK